MSSTPVYASTACLAHQFPSLSQQISAMIAAGIDHIELGHTPPLDGLELPQGLTQFPARFLVHNYFPAPDRPFVLNLASQHGPTLTRSREFCHRAIVLSAALGAEFYSVHCGFLAELDPSSLGRKLTFADITDYERGYATFAESLQILLVAAKSADIDLLVEPNVVAPFNLIEGRNALLMMAAPHELRRLVGDFSGTRLGVLLDLGHLNVTAATLGFTIPEFIDAVDAAVGAFHLHENDGTADRHQPVRAGSWMLDLLLQPRFSGKSVIVEAKFLDVTGLADHCNWLKKSLNH